MRELFRKLFGEPRESRVKTAARMEDFHDLVVQQLLAFIWPQLKLLNMELQEVPASGSYVSKRSRGYIYGIAARVVSDLPTHLQQDAVHDVMETAFSLVYGEEAAWALFQITLNECVNRDGETLTGSYHAEDDVGAVLAGKPHQSVMGFWLLNNGIGDPTAKMPPILNPRPLKIPD